MSSTADVQQALLRLLKCDDLYGSKSAISYACVQADQWDHPRGFAPLDLCLKSLRHSICLHAVERLGMWQL